MIKLEKLGANFAAVLLSETRTLYFSYETLVAFTVNGCCFTKAGDWSNTTRKHLGQAREHAKSFTTHDRVDLSPADFDEYVGMAARLKYP